MYQWIGRLTRPNGLMRWLRACILLTPRWLVFLLITLLGWATYACARRFRATVVRNMKALLPQATDRERRRMCRQYIVHECLTIYEQTIEFRKALSAKGRRRARFHLEGMGHVDEALRRGRGAIVYAPHVGNYFYQYWMMSQIYDCTTVVTAGSDELRDLFVNVHSMGGMAGYDYDTDTPRQIALKLRSHLKNNGVVFLLGDVYRDEFPDCTLFGKPSKAPVGTMMLALLQNAPIIPFHGWREGWSRHRMVFEAPLYLHERYGLAGKAEAMEELSRVMERLIGHTPQQWLYWFNVHERWKTGVTSDVDAIAVEGGRK
jgi:KDO2-lipid IV(A) lauroyltransferase